VTAVLEVCLACGFVHRDDIHRVRQSKLHLHWMPLAGERVSRLPSGLETTSMYLVYHATICVACLRGFASSLGCADRDALYMRDPLAFFRYCRAQTPVRFRAATTCVYNAGMSAATLATPEFGYLLDMLDLAYARSVVDMAAIVDCEPEVWRHG